MAPSPPGTTASSSSTSSSIRRTSKLASINPRQASNNNSARSVNTTPTGLQFSPPRASLEAIQRRLYQDGVSPKEGHAHPYGHGYGYGHGHAPVKTTSNTTDAATVLVMHALQSPAKIASPPPHASTTARGARAVSTLFPPSPNDEPHSRQHHIRTRARSRSLRSNSQTAVPKGQGKTDDRMDSDQDEDEDDDEEEEEDDTSPAPPPSRRRSLKDRDQQQQQQHPSSASSLSKTISTSTLPRKRFDLSDWQFDLAAIASTGAGAATGTPGPSSSSAFASSRHHQTSISPSSRRPATTTTAATDVKTPTSRSFPSSLSLHQGKANASSSYSPSHSPSSTTTNEVSPARTILPRASCAELRPSSKRTSRDHLRLRKSANASSSSAPISSSSASASSAASAASNAFFPATAPQQARQQRDAFASFAPAPATARPPLQYRPNQPQLQTSFGQAGSASLFGTPLSAGAGDHSSAGAASGSGSGSSASASPFATSARRSSRPLSSRALAHSSHHHHHQRAHSRNKSIEHGGDASLKMSSSSRGAGALSAAETRDGLDRNISSSFDACASAIRHRQRTKSISESEGGDGNGSEDSEDDNNNNEDESFNFPDSPDLVHESGSGNGVGAPRDGYIEAGIFSGMSVEDAKIGGNGGHAPAHHNTPGSGAGADEMQLDDESQSSLEIRQSPADTLLSNRHHHQDRHQQQREFDDVHDSLFLDTPGRTRGASMPSDAFGQPNYTLTTSLPPHPFQSQLKSSRVSYPPKILYTHKTDHEDGSNDSRSKNPLHSSVPASGKSSSSTNSNSTSTSRPLDQLFLASILNGSGSVSGGISALPSNSSLSVKRQPSGSLSKSAGSSSLVRTSDALKGSKSLQPLSPHHTSHVGRKRNANGNMIVSNSAGTSRENSVNEHINNTAQMDVYHGRPSLDGSTDEESGLSPTLPPLTDSSSATSSLASSQRSGQYSKLNQRERFEKPQTVSEHENESNSSLLDDLSFLSDSTMPSFVVENTRGGGSGGHLLPRTFSTNQDLAASSNSSNGSGNGGNRGGGIPRSSGQLKSPGTPGFPSGIPRRTSPHFKNVRPLQAAFVNSGLLSKKSIRSRLDRDSGIGLGATPPAPALRRLLHQDRKDNNLSLQSTPGASVSLSFSTPSHYTGSPGMSSMSMSMQQQGSPVPTVEIAPSLSMEAESFAVAAASANASSISQSRRMPDTPCKRPPLHPHLRQVQAAATENSPAADKEDSSSSKNQVVPGLHPLAQCSRPTTGRSASSCSSTVSDSSSVANSIPGSAVKIKDRFFRSPTNLPRSANNSNSNRLSRKSNGSGSPSSAGSPCAMQMQDNQPKSAIPRRRIGPALFRRRSSGQIQTSADGSFMALSERSGGSTRCGVVDWEPMTPTRTSAENEWLALPSLTTSPHPHASASKPFLTTDSAGTESAMVSPTSPLATSPLAMQFIRANDTRVSPDSLPQASIPPVKHMPRPAFRARHSSSVVHSARQTELMSPDRFSTFFSITRTIGQGEFSEAFEVRDRSNDDVYAIKKTKVPLVGHKARLRRLEEVDILRLLSKDTAPSPYIIRMFDAWEQTGNLYIQTELCPFGNLSYFLEEYGRMYEFLDEARVWKILAEVTSGLAYIHQHGVLHLDIKPANIFIAQNGSLKIGDFGLATRWPRVKPITILQGAAIHSPGWDAAAASSVWLSERTRSQSSNDKEASRESMQDLEREGDREYIAPEILRGEYGRPADMFALGLLILEAAANVVLPDNGLPWRKLREDDLSDVEIGHLSDELLYIIVHLLQSDPAARSTVDDLQSHPVICKMQSLRLAGFQHEDADSASDEALSKPSSSTVLYAKGAIVEEAEGFLPKVMAEVRRIWHSPGGRTNNQQQQRRRTDTIDESTAMEVDEN